MALPSNIQTFTLTFGSAGVLGISEDLAMRVTITSATSALWAATGQPFLLKPQFATADLGAEGTAVLISPDQDGFTNGAGQAVRNWTYAIHIDYLDATGDTVGSADKNLAYVASMGSPVDLDATVPVSTSAGVVVDIPSSSYGDEQARDALAAALRGTSGITVTVNDVANTITIAGYDGGTVFDTTGTGTGTGTGTTSTYLATEAGDLLVTESGDNLTV